MWPLLIFDGVILNVITFMFKSSNEADSMVVSMAISIHRLFDYCFDCESLV